MMELSKISEKGQVTVPTSIREKLGLKKGDKLLFIETEDGNIVITNPNKVSITNINIQKNK